MYIANSTLIPLSAPAVQRGLVRLRLVKRLRGFTLIELIMVVVILGVLAVFAAPRIFNTGDFNARGFHDETLSLLRYAQKTAIAQRRTVCVTFSSVAPAYATLAVASSSGSNVCDGPLIGPNKSTYEKPVGSGVWYCDSDGPLAGALTQRGCIYAKSGIAYSPTASAISFNGLGQPLDAAGALLTAQTAIQISNSTPVYVEANTGYVHD